MKKIIPILTIFIFGFVFIAGCNTVQQTTPTPTNTLTPIPITTIQTTTSLTSTPKPTLTNVDGMHPRVYATTPPTNNLTLILTNGDSCFSVANITQLHGCPSGLWDINITPDLCRTYSTGSCFLVWIHKSCNESTPGVTIKVITYDSGNNIIQTKQEVHAWTKWAPDENGNWGYRDVFADKYSIICGFDQSAMLYSVEVSKTHNN